LFNLVDYFVIETIGVMIYFSSYIY